MRRAAIALLALAACKGKRDPADHKGAPVELAGSGSARDAGVGADAAGPAWTTALDKLPLVTSVREVVLPSRPDHPRFSVVGPVVLGDLAIVGSSQLGFAAVDWRRGAIAWTKAAGAQLAPPIVVDDQIVLIGDCVSGPDVPDGDELLGCLRSVSASGADTAYIAIHGKTREVDEFSHAVGDQEVLADGDDLWWRRGELAVAINPVSGVASATLPKRPALAVDYRDRHWDVTQEAGVIHARGKTAKDTWKSDRPMPDLLGVVRLPKRPPMLRFAGNENRFGPEVRLLDVDALGSLNGAVSWDAVPGIAVLAHAMSPIGDVALAVRLDKTIKHDYIAGYSANALLRWAWPLPETARVDPIGIAIGLDADRAPEAVVVFHDGDTVTILPELSSPPTAPGAARGPSENSTP